MAALGEYMQIFKGKIQSLVFLTLGTGVGGGIIYNGELLTGNINYAELGHMTLVAEGRLCSCGKRGCVEKYCSSSAIIADYAEGSGEEIEDVRIIADKAHDGDFAAYAAFEMFALHLAHTVSSASNIFGPTHIRIGGGLSELAELYYPAMQTILSDITFPAFKKRTEVSISTLKNDAALYGGLEWAKRMLK